MDEWPAAAAECSSKIDADEPKRLQGMQMTVHTMPWHGNKAVHGRHSPGLEKPAGSMPPPPSCFGALPAACAPAATFALPAASCPCAPFFLAGAAPIGGQLSFLTFVSHVSHLATQCAPTRIHIHLQGARQADRPLAVGLHHMATMKHQQG